MTVHGPHLLRDYYRDLDSARSQARQLDNSPEDLDPRPDRIDLGDQQSILTADGFALREANMLVWLRGSHVGNTYTMVQEGYDRDSQGCYAYPLSLTGPGDTPFDPPDAERIPAATFAQAMSRFEEEWMLTPA